MKGPADPTFATTIDEAFGPTLAATTAPGMLSAAGRCDRRSILPRAIGIAPIGLTRTHSGHRNSMRPRVSKRIGRVLGPVPVLAVALAVIGTDHPVA
jgi:hypothetical protein